MNTVSLEIMSPRLATVFTAILNNFAIIALTLALGSNLLVRLFMKSAC